MHLLKISVRDINMRKLWKISVIAKTAINANFLGFNFPNEGLMVLSFSKIPMNHRKLKDELELSLIK